MIYVDVRILHERFPGKYDHIQSGRVPVTAEELRASARPPRAIQGGPGTALKSLLRDWLGIEGSPTCSCSSMGKKMDALGPEWCEGEGMAEILDVMRAEHAKRWAAGKTILPWTDIAARQLVLLACRRARAKANG
jgi:hypothetical protein